MQSTIKYIHVRSYENSDVNRYDRAVLAVNDKVILNNQNLAASNADDKTREVLDVAKSIADALSAPMCVTHFAVQEIDPDVEDFVYTLLAIDDNPEELLIFANEQDAWEILYDYCPDSCDTEPEKSDDGDDADADRDTSSPPGLTASELYAAAALSYMSNTEVTDYLKSQSSVLDVVVFTRDDLEEFLLGSGCDPSDDNIDRLYARMKEFYGGGEHFHNLAMEVGLSKMS